MNPLRLSPRRFCNYIWHWALERVPDDDRESWEAMMSAPLRQVPGRERVPTQRELEDETAAFGAFYASVNSG